MTIHFAAARSTAHSPIARALARRAAGFAANDNGTACPDDEKLLHAALRHFAAHGLGAAREARRQAEQAFYADDRQSFEWWLAVCRTLDRRLADQLERATAGAASAG